MVTLEEVKGLKVAELKEELKKLGVDIDGKERKPELVARLEEALSSADTATSTATQIQTSVPASAPTATANTGATALTAANGRVAISFTGTDASKAGAAGQATPAVEPTDKPAPIETTVLSEAEKRKQRADRFGIPASQEEKKAARAARFGTAQPAETKASEAGTEGIAPLSQADKAALDDKKKDRAKRFNLPLTLSKEEIDKQKKARLERFGAGANGTATSGGTATAPALKADDSAAMQAKLAARAERFALGNNAEQATKPPATASKVEEPKKPLDPETEAKRKAREIKFVPK